MTEPERAGGPAQADARAGGPAVPYRRIVTASRRPTADGSERCTARVDDWFHGFEVVLDVRDGRITAARATAHRHPWTTCAGALPSVEALVGVPLADAATTVVRLGRAATCVHVNDLVWLAGQGHAERRYDVEVTPAAVVTSRDGDEVLRWPLAGWVVTDGPFAGTTPFGTGFATVLDRLGADDDLREAVRVARRGAAVGCGYHTLDWPNLHRGHDVEGDVMAGTCHAFSPGVIERTVRLAEPPR